MKPATDSAGPGKRFPPPPQPSHTPATFLTPPRRRWNRYPGARVDSEVPEYELSIPEVYKDWTWTTNYPDFRELRAYFDHVDKVLDISKDTAFGSVVVDAQFDTGAGKWSVKTADGRTARPKFLIIAAGFAAKRYVPDWPGIDSFKGMLFVFFGCACVDFALVLTVAFRIHLPLVLLAGGRR